MAMTYTRYGSFASEARMILNETTFDFLEELLENMRNETKQMKHIMNHQHIHSRQRRSASLTLIDLIDLTDLCLLLPPCCRSLFRNTGTKYNRNSRVLNLFKYDVMEVCCVFVLPIVEYCLCLQH